MPIIRTKAELDALDPTPIEQELIAACQAGEPCRLGNDVPTGPSAARTIRADILRYLLLGGCEACPVDGRGADLWGAYIKGPLDLDFATVKGATQLRKCHFDSQVDAIQTRFDLLNLSGSTLQGLRADGAEIKGDVFLRNLTASATIDFASATIGGHLACEGAHLNATEGFALFAQGAEIKGGVFLHNLTASATVDVNSATIGGQLACEGAQLTPANGAALSAHSTKIDGGVFLYPPHQEDRADSPTPFSTTGDVDFTAAAIGGFYTEDIIINSNESDPALSLRNISCDGPLHLTGATIKGEVRLNGARISGDLSVNKTTFENDTGHAFTAQRIRVDQSFIWKKTNLTQGAVSLNGAHVAELDDDPDNWPDADHLFLDGFTYDRIRGKVSTSPERMKWLKAGSYFDGEFRPQPYSQYAKFLRDTGHEEQARQVLATRERYRLANARKKRSASGDTFAGPKNLWFWFWDLMLRVVVGYGYRPFNSVIALAILIILAIVPAHLAWEEGSFAPNASPILVTDAWTALAATDPHPAAVWTGDRLPAVLPDKTPDMTLAEWQVIAPGRDWETFNRYAYGFDVVIPIINFGQTEAWTPSTNRGPWGWHLWWARWVLTALGWIVTALGAAAITGIIRRD